MATVLGSRGSIGVGHRCPPLCHFCPDMAEVSDGETAFMPWCYGGAVSGFEACHCSAGDFDVAELVRQRDYLRGELRRVEDRIRVAEAAANRALVAMPRRKGA